MGATDFDFLFAGPWDVRNHRLAGRDPGARWEEFGARAEARPLPGGLGHVDLLSVPDFPGAGSVEAFTVRLYEPASGLWRIWWSSSTRPGHLDPPMTGSFTDGVGTFLGDDVPELPPVRVRFLWMPHAPDGPHWEQARSWDGGATWRTDWTMDLRPATG